MVLLRGESVMHPGFDRICTENGRIGSEFESIGAGIDKKKKNSLKIEIKRKISGIYSDNFF